MLSPSQSLSGSESAGDFTAAQDASSSRSPVPRWGAMVEEEVERALEGMEAKRGLRAVPLLPTGGKLRAF